MAISDLTPDERGELSQTIQDLSTLFEIDKIPASEISPLIDSFESERVSRYLRHLREGSKPETALRESLIAGGTPLAKFLSADNITPEFNAPSGFVDYRITETVPVLLELKPPFVPKYDSDGNLVRLQSQRLNWRKHQDQIENYQSNNEYLIFTNLRKWFFFSRYSKSGEPISSGHAELTQFYDEFSRSPDIAQYLDRLYDISTKGELDDTFFEALNRWVDVLDEMKFLKEIDQDSQTERTIWLINKFIFTQTLDSYSVVDFNWVSKSWDRNERKWLSFSTQRFLEEFLEEVTQWFHTYYDTELFQGTILDYVVKDSDNIELIYTSLKDILGLNDWQHKGASPGITNFNFREVNEDIFGKAYEKYLAEVRKDQGIYYTPKYVTEYITKDTVKKRFADVSDEVVSAVEDQRYEDAVEKIQEFKQLSVIDPACGSGSFLIKSLRYIWKEYQKIISVLEEQLDSHAGFESGTLDRSDQDDEIYAAAQQALSELGYQGDRDLMSKIILRHLHGADLDRRALDVAKLNIWLEAIKIIPGKFHYRNIAQGEGYVLPDLDWNMCHGDSLVGLPISETMQHLSDDYSDEISQLDQLRRDYTEDPTDEETLLKGRRLLSDLQRELDSIYSNYLDEKGIEKEVFDQTVPSYWGLHFWRIFSSDDPGFDIVVGNPPYVGEKDRKERFSLLKEASVVNECYRGRMDMLYFFVLLGAKVGSDSGVSSMITTAYWPAADSAQNLRRELLKLTSVSEILAFDGYTVFDQAPGQENLIYKLDHSPKSSIKFSYIKSNSLPRADVANSLLSDKDLFHQSEYSHDEFELPTDGSEWYGIRGLAKGSLQYPETTDTLACYFNSKQGIVPAYDSVTSQSYEDYDNPDISVGEGIFVLDPDDLDRIGIDEEHSLLEPLYANSDISAFFIDYPADWFLLYITSAVDIDQYPLIKNHLSRYKTKLETRREVESGKIEWYSLQWPRSREVFETPKIAYANWGNDWQPYAVAEAGKYERRDITLLKPKDKDCDLHKFTALLNSSPAEYWQTEHRGRTGYSTQGSLEDLPIPDRLTDSIANNAEQITKIKTAKSAFRTDLATASKQMRQTTRSLGRILLNDRDKIREGSPETAWTDSVEFYPGQNEDSEAEEFQSFYIYGELDNRLISITGLNGQVGSQIYQMTFADADLIELAYTSLKQLNQSAKTVSSLEDIFEKTSVPIIREGSTSSSANIVSEARRQFRQRSEPADLGVQLSSISMDRAVDLNQATIDAEVVRAYDFDRTDAKAIIDSIVVHGKQRQRILNSL